MSFLCCLHLPLTIKKHQHVLNKVISANTANYDLKADSISDGWDQYMPLIAVVTINAGISVYPFSTGTTFSAGTSLSIVNNGFISGPITNGYSVPATPALVVTAPISITNNGTVRGAGGSGGGAHPYTGGYVAGGEGAHGITAAANGVFWDGGGGNTATPGNGGTWGAAGTAGSGSNPVSNEPGLAAGPCTSGNASITWLVAGTRLGTLA